jgi:putative hydrolase
VSTPGPPGGFNPFEKLFADLGRMFAQQGPVNWDVARQIALFLATEGEAQANVDPLERMRLEELVRVADLHVAERTGLATAVTGGVLTVAPVTRGDWAMRSLDAYKPLFEQLAVSLSASGDDGGVEDHDDELSDDATEKLLGDLGKMVAPVLLGLQAGSMLGHLSRRSLGQYDLPIPRPRSDELLVVPANLDAFAEEWSLAPDDLRLWVCLHEVTHHAVLGRPHVRARLETLIGDYVSSFEVDPTALQGMMGSFDPADPEAMQAAFADTEVLLGALQSPAQHDLLATIETLTVVLEGFVDHVMDAVGEALIGSYGMLSEAVRRRRVEASDGDRFVERLLGLQLGQAQYDRGAAFVRGVIERAGDEGLARLWHSARELPTPAEVDAPGLWLARIELPDDVPDDLPDDH